ncbi:MULTISPECIES: methyltransferase domain-containing protein [Methylomonas]|uniref:Methyltransferase n=2 Tax=Methylomonas TaxID=416 RepID=A0A126T568_9GAMM|nr:MULTISPECIES: methyltransferase domain-containing protein [Methylomonas]AMK77233.1 methyltransferase [Methylomonas denitrificans]OAI03130.1 methyltransferase [Methylomonas methanica]TCV76449.1 methyltransferase family protein [Methylomonas methanica]
MDVKEEDILGESVYGHWYYVSKGNVIRHLLKPVAGKSVLDVGAGSGVFSKSLMNHDLVENARCVDTAYEVDEKLESYKGKCIRFVRSVKSADESLVLMIDVLEHVEDDLVVLKYYSDQIPSGGHVLISVPAFNFLWSGHDVFLEHKRRYTLAKLERLVNSAGLEVVKGRYFFGFLFPVVAVIRLIKRALLNAGQLSAKSDLTKSNNFVNFLLIAVHVIELKVLFSVNRIVGLTAFCLAKKP